MAATIFFKSKLEPFRIIAWGLLASLIIPSATALILANFTDYANHLKPDDQKGIFVVPWIFMAAGCWGLYRATRGKQTLVVDDVSIHVGSRIINYRDIENIDVLARKALSFWSGEDEFVVITLKSKDELNIRVGNYTNANQFRAICQKIKENVSEQIYSLPSFTPPFDVNIHAISVTTLQNENFTVFKSRPFRFFGLLYPPFLWGLSLVAVGEFLTIEKDPAAIIVLVVAALLALVGFYMLYIILSQQNRFLLSANYLVIKSNVFLPSPVIALKDIKRITPDYFNSGRGMPRGDYLLIITSDYRLHTFGIPASYKPLQEMIDKVNAGIK